MKNKALWLVFSIILLAGSTFSQIAPKPPFDSLGRRVNDTAAGTCNSARKGYRYYNTTSNIWEFCNGTVWGSLSGGSSGITVGTTTSDGTANALLKTNGSSKVVSSNVTDDGTLVTSSIPFAAPAAFSTTNPGFTFAGFPSAGFTQSGSGATIYAIGSGRAIALDNGNQQIMIGSVYQYVWSSGAVGAAGQDTGFKRVAAAVIAASDASTGLGWVQTAGLSRVSSNVTNATATPAAITGLSSTLVAGRKYAGTITLIAKNSTAAEGLQFDLNGGSATFTNVQFLFTATPIGSTLGVTTSSAIGTALTATTATTTDIAYTIYFTCVVNAAGTVIPRFAEVSHTSGTATVELGSSMRLEDIP